MRIRAILHHPLLNLARMLEAHRLKGGGFRPGDGDLDIIRK